MLNLSTHLLRKAMVFSLMAIAFTATSLAQAQSTYNFGRNVEVAYEGWRPLEDGTFNFMFGYMNENWEEEPNIEIGENNLILEDNTIQPFVKIGSNNVFWSGNHIGHDVEICNHVYITSHVVISGFTKIGNNCFL